MWGQGWVLAQQVLLAAGFTPLGFQQKPDPLSLLTGAELWEWLRCLMDTQLQCQVGVQAMEQIFSVHFGIFH